MHHDPPESEPTPPSGPEELLRRLEARLDRASTAAEQLLADAVSGAARRREQATAAGPEHAAAPAGRAPERPGNPERAGNGTEPPPAGWQVPEPEGASPGPRDTELLLELFSTVRDLIPPDLQRRLAEALRELLLALRALIDWYLERAEQRRREPAEVQDIPIT
jgi:hypothetical protein